MLAVNYTELRSNMKAYMDRVTEDCETLLITRTMEQENVIALAEDSYNSLRETLELVEPFANHQWLMQSLQQLAAGLSRVQAVSGVDRAIIFSDNAWQDYCALQAEDRKTAGRIDAMLADIAAGDSGNKGHSRPLQGDLHGCWSRRINDCDRLIYRPAEDGVQVLTCRLH